MPDGALTGIRVLVVEDEYLLADELAIARKAADAMVLGPAPTVKAALDPLTGEVQSAAAVDTKLGGEMAYWVADALLACGASFLFTTEYDRATLPERYAAVRRLESPPSPLSSCANCDVWWPTADTRAEITTDADRC